ncbi:hypothetical protein [Vibrio comitans]|uniref:Uncharacterized protein n=1 Tax=Vibrio comitans NBRC 102076 TaxID=1219078 RepID=A0A4Y3IH86_9VIBR|nr:hypothetical protein [Vibrio comitans]GEA58849.1 hypothetical protein VCO01S_00420 [Vibrio comitans NBRC 102076]
MKKSLLLIVASLCYIPSLSSAPNDNVINKSYFNQLSSELGVTVEQKALIDEFYYEYRSNIEVIPWGSLVSIREQQFELLTETELDIDSLSNFIDQIHQYEKTVVLQEMKFKHSVFNVLNEHQKDKLGRIFYRDLLNSQRNF